MRRVGNLFTEPDVPNTSTDCWLASRLSSYWVSIFRLGESFSGQIVQSGKRSCPFFSDTSSKLIDHGDLGLPQGYPI